MLVIAIAACKSEPKTTPASGSAVTAPAIDATMSVQLMTDARAAMAEQRWVDAVVSARSVEELEPTNAEAADIAKKAMKEGRHESAYKELLDAVKSVDRTAAAAAFEKIAADSFYKPLATDAYKSLDAK